MKVFSIGNSTKAVPLDGITSWADWGLPWQTPSTSQRKPWELLPFVGYLYRAVDLRANAVASVPWSIYPATGDTPLWDSAEPIPPQNLVPFVTMPDLLYRTEAALCIGARAYWFKERNRVRLTGLRWLDPFTMEPVWTPRGLAGFKRHVNGNTQTLLPEDVAYLWLGGLSETEPRPAPAQAAASAANVIYNTAQFAKAYFERGAVRAGLLTVEGQPLPTERERLKNWWSRFMSGIGNAFNAEVVSAAVQYVPVGEGLAELGNQALIAEQREDIATALGVPHSLVMSNAANYATARQDAQSFYETTVVPQTQLIERQLNAQVFGPAGLRLKFRPQALDVFQQDENERATAFAQYVGAGLKPSIVAQMLGLDLPEGVTYEDLDPDPAPAPVVVTQPPPPPTNQPDDAEDDTPDSRAGERDAEVRRFLRWAKKRHDPDVSEFKSAILSDAEKGALLGEMRTTFRLDWSAYP